MKCNAWFVIGLTFSGAGALGCGEASTPSAAGNSSTVHGKVTADSAAYLLPEKPAGARGVIELRMEAKDGGDIVVQGRIGGSREPFVKGRAAFTIVDAKLKPCNEIEGDTCPAPWDYCCSCGKEELAQAMLMVKFVDDSGKTLAEDSQSLLHLKPLDTVVVCGKAKRDPEGNLIVLADKIHVGP